MTELSFKTIKFVQNRQKPEIDIFLMDYFKFSIPNEELGLIAPFTIDKNTITFHDGINETKVKNQFYTLLSNRMQNMRNIVNQRPAVYIHQNSGIPLIGSIYFGLVDRNTNLIEIKPMTGCNMDCNYCSVDEGHSTKDKVDIIIEKDHVINEFKKLAEFKACELEANLNPHGDPSIYSEIFDLISDLRKISNVKTISMITKAAVFNEKYVDKLENAGLTRVNLSVDTLNPETASKLYNMPVKAAEHYIAHIKKISAYIAKKPNLDLIFGPVLVQGYNENDLKDVVKFAVEIGAGKNCPPVGIQNFLNYRHGRNPVKQLSWEKFGSILTEIEKDTGVRLHLNETDFKMFKTKNLPKPFKKGNMIKAEVKSIGHRLNEKIAVAGDRNITLIDNQNKAKIGKNYEIRITGDKHNIFYGILA